MSAVAITDQEFSQFQRFILEAAGITLSSAKKALVCGRLGKRLQYHRLGSYAEYLKLLRGDRGGAEVQLAVDLLTTNETYFFREPRHFDVLRQVAESARRRAQPLRVWSAACSSGEEAYTIAMVLGDCLGDGGAWDVLGSDISRRMLQQAQHGHYVMARGRGIPPALLRRYCLRGTGEQDGTFLVSRELRQRVRFAQVNLSRPLPQLGSFDVVFLRNVMIYFSAETKRQVVARVLGQLRPGGHFIIGHSESLNDITDAVAGVAPSVYRKRQP